MRLLMLLAVLFLAVALVCALVPTAALGEGSGTWLIAGLLCWALDALLGGWVVALPARKAAE